MDSGWSGKHHIFKIQRPVELAEIIQFSRKNNLTNEQIKELMLACQTKDRSIRPEDKLSSQDILSILQHKKDISDSFSSLYNATFHRSKARFF